MSTPTRDWAGIIPSCGESGPRIQNLQKETWLPRFVAPLAHLRFKGFVSDCEDSWLTLEPSGSGLLVADTHAAR